ncbi:M20 family metallo-hydrolase [Pseudooceanicola sp. CBS1P-1]|uniref:Hydantoinase/carbamoylase family amidase n=1 Tax=Pseudooceanicola albus TaxID=2692189 RepID=A0A6L7G7V8_9RHOB|nr:MULTISPECIES: M20 family metallo-hydrolase [Pseudooceanicola]MBT9385951.1 M20 family metallo-hydrolase [Pseudooceanicola endophyticus]MXN19628.1 hydantoinase/carbamoylase family amidase [Pseudooceanicola albus]
MPACLQIDAARLWSDLMTMGAIGATPAGGSYRPALSPADREARNLFRHWAQEAGLSVGADAIGTLYARMEGLDPQADPVLIGSHLDTQMPGGRFDGVLGVLAGLEVCRALTRAGITPRRPLEVVNWTNEEGARFQPGVMGSALFAGTLSLPEALERRDATGLRLAEAMAENAPPGPLPFARPVHSYLELHIEQGPELERTGTQIGLVDRSSCMCSGYVTIRGENGHTQTAPMSRRRNALVAAARLVLEIERIGAAQEPEGMVSASVLDVWPNNRVNIPHRAEMSYAVVHMRPEGRAAITAQIEEAVSRIARETGLEITLEHRHFREALTFDADLRARALTLAQARGYSVAELATLTAHDALSMQPLCPTALIFVPCRDGISHSEAEWCSPEDAARGAQLLADLALEQVL